MREVGVVPTHELRPQLPGAQDGDSSICGRKPVAAHEAYGCPVAVGGQAVHHIGEDGFGKNVLQWGGSSCSDGSMPAAPPAAARHEQ